MINYIYALYDIIYENTSIYKSAIVPCLFVCSLFLVCLFVSLLVCLCLSRINWKD